MQTVNAEVINFLQYLAKLNVDIIKLKHNFTIRNKDISTLK